MEDKTFAQKVREKYGDSVEEFALRIGVRAVTITSWESGVTPQPQVLALLSYANNYHMGMKSDASEEHQNMSVPQLVKCLMRLYNDTEAGLAIRLGLNKAQIMRLLGRSNVNKSTKRLLLEAATHHERFMAYPKSFSK